MIYNALTIDVEDYFMVSGFADIVRFDDWHTYESRIEQNTGKILDLLDQYHVKATFFILGWVAEHYPNLVRDVMSGNHEIACHGYNHRLVYDLTPDEFRDDVRRAKDVLEDITGMPVVGYRAASYSIVKETLWALDVLIEEGFRYDSSIFPIHHDRYGVPDAHRFPHVMKRKQGEIYEFPPTTYQFLGQNIPVSGGGYFRFFPLPIIKSALRRINVKEKQPAIIYLHPWEIDKDQPRLNGRWASRIRHYMNLQSTETKLKAFLDEFRFQPLSAFYAISSHLQ